MKDCAIPYQFSSCHIFRRWSVNLKCKLLFLSLVSQKAVMACSICVLCFQVNDI